MALFVFLPAATGTRIIAAKLRLGVPEWLLRLTGVVVTTVRPVHMRFGCFGLGFHHTGYSWDNSELVSWLAVVCRRQS